MTHYTQTLSVDGLELAKLCESPPYHCKENVELVSPLSLNWECVGGGGGGGGGRLHMVGIYYNYYNSRVLVPRACACRPPP